jgi:hypothetical protein
VRHLFAIAILGASAVGCKTDEVVWEGFNADDQTLIIEVLPADSPKGEPISIELLSNLERTVVGEATADPGSGPVGTLHWVTVDVFDEFEGIVGRVSVEVDTEAVDDLDGDGEPDSRGEGEWDMRQDSADPGAFAIMLESLGDEDEEREDRFTIRLWQAEELAPGVETDE